MIGILAIIGKELRSLLKDPKSRFVVIGPPVIQLFVFGYAATYDVTDVPFAVYNENPGLESRELVAKFEGAPSFKRVATLTSDDQMQAVLDERRVRAIIHIGPQFTRNLHSGKGARVQMVLDGRDSNTAMITLGYAGQIIREFNTTWAKGEGRNAGPPVRLEFRSWYNPNLLSRWYIVPGIVGLLTLVVTLVVTSLSVAREREQSTFDQLLVTPLHPWEILTGKAATGFLIGTFEATVIIAAAHFWFKVPLVGSLSTLYFGMALFIISVVGTGLMISSLSVTQQQALLGAFLFLVPAVILSGFSTPIENMPLVVQKITYLDPLRYIMVILRGVFLEGTSFHLLINQFIPLAVIGLVTMVAAAWLFRRRMY